MKIKDNKRIYIIISLILVFILLFIFCVFNNKIEGTKASVFEISNSDISITINDTNNYEGNDKIAEFYFTDLKTINITIDFKDVVSRNKKIEVNLKEGLTYKLYPVLSNTDNDMHTVINKSDSLYNAISNVSYPAVEEVGYQDTNPYKYIENNVSYGKLIYDVYENVSKVTLSINVMVDWQKMYPALKSEETGIYNNKLLEDAIKVTTYKEGNKINELSTNVKIVSNGDYSYYFKKSDHNYNKSVFASTDEVINYGFTYANESRLFINGRNTYFSFPNSKRLEYTFYYPKGTEFVDIVYYTTDSPIKDCVKVLKDEESNASCTIKDIPSDTEDNKVVLTTTTFRKDFVTPLSVRYKVKSIKELGFDSSDDKFTWSAIEPDNVRITFYDGVQRTYFSDVVASLNIYHPDSFINKMGIRQSGNGYEDKSDDTFIYGPSFVIENSTPGIKTNQTLEYEIDSNYEAIAVTFPRLSGVVLKNIQYQTNKNNEWQDYKDENNNYKQHTSSRFTILDAGFKLDDDIYFTKVRGVVESYKENYVSSVSSPYDYTNAVVFGNLKSSADEAKVTFRMYETPISGNAIDEKTLTELTKKVVYTNKLEIGSFPDGILFVSKENESISKVFTTEQFYVSGYIKPHRYPYGTRLYMENTNIYLRQPKGIILDIENMQLEDKDGKDIAYKIETKENAFGEKVYIVKTNKTTGYGLSKANVLNNIEETITIKLKYHISSNCKLNSIALNDLVAYGNENYKYVSRGKNDDNDLNANGITDEQISNVSPEVLVIEPKKGFSIASSVVKDGIIYDEYNENNIDTIIEVKQNDVFEYVFDIKNNTEDSINNYEIYIPIAKKGTNYGESFQKEAFNFDVSLLETLISNELYDVYYSTDKNIKNITIPSNMNYVTNINDKSLVTMIKIVSKKAVNQGEFFTIGLKLKVDKNNSADTNININNVLYNISSSTLTGTFKSNSNAFKLYAPSISGFVFNDLNMDKKYDDKDIPIISDVLLELYKFNNKTYEKVSDINVDSKTGYFVIEDANTLSKGVYALKVNVPDYYIYSDLTYDGWIKDISLLESKSYYYEIGYIKYDIDFNIEDKIIGVGKKEEISIKDLKPDYFDLIKNEESAYFWNISEEDSKYLKVYDKNSPSIEIEGLEETKEDVKVCALVVDRYNNKKEKCAKVKVKGSLAPIVKAEDAHILVGSKIKYEEYLKEAVDYKDNKIKLDFNKNVKVTSDIIHENGIATKVGVYNVTYEVTDDYGNVGTAKIKIYVDPISAIITNPSTYDNIIINIIIIVVSFITVILTGIFIYKKRYRN